jgi:hypothetical protein
MNETDCVLQGKRLLCIPSIKKASVKGVHLPLSAVIWESWEINITDGIFPETLSMKSWNKGDDVLRDQARRTILTFQCEGILLLVQFQYRK